MRSILLCLLVSSGLHAQTKLTFEEPVKQRLFVLTDITNEPDDQESLVRLLVYSNEYDLEGIVATTSTHLRNQVRRDKIEGIVQHYGLVKANLDKHSSGYPTKEYLQSIISEHLPVFSMEGVGEGKDSPGSELLIRAVDLNDERPLWVSVWGGANCLAQALWKVKSTRSKEELKTFISRLRVYTISDQDFTGKWIRDNFLDVFYIVDPSAGDSWLEYYKATWTGISGDSNYRNGPGMFMELVSNPWLAENIRENHGPLAADYIPFAYIMEGDTPSYLGLINNGLGWYNSPSFGGWGGRYDFFQSYTEKGKIWTSSVNSMDDIELPNHMVETSNQATIWRWRESYQNDFAARMDWNVTEVHSKANHNPVLVLNGNKGKSVGTASIKPGEQVQLSANGSTDPDGDSLNYRWFVYGEAGRFDGNLKLENDLSKEITFTMPEVKSGQSIHIILEVKDSGSPSLFSFRRVILKN